MTFVGLPFFLAATAPLLLLLLPDFEDVEDEEQEEEDEHDDLLAAYSVFVLLPGDDDRDRDASDSDGTGEECLAGPSQKIFRFLRLVCNPDSLPN